MATPNHILSGIYKITHIDSGKVYVGSAVNITFRWTVHRSDLRNLSHHSSKLQRAWNKHGADAFEFSVLEYVAERTNLIEREQYWMDELRATANGYNMRPSARSNLGLKASEETKARMSATKTGRPKSAEAKKNIAAAMKRYMARPEVKEIRRTINIGRKATEETKAKMSAAHKGKKRSEQGRANIAAAIARRTITPEHRAKMIEGKKAYVYTPEHRANISSGNKGKTISQAQKDAQSKLMTGRRLSAETKAKVSAFLTGRKWSAESIAKRSATVIAKNKEKRAQQFPADGSGQLYLSFM